jgi:glycosyltransferase involved in cell wall biosynthesis
MRVMANRAYALAQKRPMTTLRASLIIAVYNAVHELELVLAGYSRQSFRDFEVVIADDGTGPEMTDFINAFSQHSHFPIRYVCQPHDGFRKCKILNEAIRVSSGDYLIFADGDCIPHSRFLEAHMSNRRSGTVLCGRRVNLTQRFSASLTSQDVQSGRLDRRAPALVLDLLLGRLTRWEEGVIIKSRALRNWIEGREPTLFGCNFSVEKSLLEQVNGFNEDFVAYCYEDFELQHRLQLAGAQIRWVRHQAIQYHLYHPPRVKAEVSRAVLERSISEGQAACRNGLVRK